MEQVRYPHILPDELGRLHEARGVKSACWMCGHTEWSLQSTASDPFRLLPGSEDEGETLSMGTQANAVFPLMCKNCGTVWMISYAFVRTWLKANPAPEEPSHV